MIPDLHRIMSRLTVRQLRVLLAVADHGSLVAAARHLRMSQPAISKALQETEALLGVTLFSRTNRGVVPTVFGEALAAHSRVITTQLHHATEEINDLRDGMGGRIVAGTLLAASADLLPRAIAKLRQERPKVAISVVNDMNDRLLPDLRLGKLDLVVGRLPEPDEAEGLHLEALITDVSCVVVRAGHPLVSQPGLTLAEVADRDWVLPGPETGLRRQIETAFREQNAPPPRRAVNSVSQLIARRLVLDHDYLAVWPWLVARRDVQDNNVAILPFQLLATRGPVGVSTRAEDRLSPASQVLVQALREVASSIETYPPSVEG